MRAIVAALAVALAAVLPGAPAPAQEPEQPERTRLILSESATREVEQDLLVAVVSARAEAASAREAQQAVNAAMAAAAEKARALEEIRVATGGYRVYQQYDRDGRPTSWIAEQDLRLRSGRVVPLLELVGELQDDGMVVGALGYELSPSARRALENELALEAIEGMRARAQEIAASMGTRVDGIQTIRVGGAMGEPPVRPMMRTTMAEAADAVPPVTLPDLETVSVSVEAEVMLAPQ